MSFLCCTTLAPLKGSSGGAPARTESPGRGSAPFHGTHGTHWISKRSPLRVAWKELQRNSEFLRPFNCGKPRALLFVGQPTQELNSCSALASRLVTRPSAARPQARCGDHLEPGLLAAALNAEPALKVKDANFLGSGEPPLEGKLMLTQDLSRTRPIKKGGVPSKSDESPLKGDTPLLINQGFINPGLTLTGQTKKETALCFCFVCSCCFLSSSFLFGGRVAWF